MMVHSSMLKWLMDGSKVACEGGVYKCASSAVKMVCRVDGGSHMDASMVMMATPSSISLMPSMCMYGALNIVCTCCSCHAQNMSIKAWNRFWGLTGFGRLTG